MAYVAALVYLTVRWFGPAPTPEAPADAVIRHETRCPRPSDREAADRLLPPDPDVQRALGQDGTEYREVPVFIGPAEGTVKP